MSGIDYTKGFVVTPHGGRLLFNLNGEYDTVKMKVGHIDNSGNNWVRLTIYADGKQVKQIELEQDDMPEDITIPVNNAK